MYIWVIDIDNTVADTKDRIDAISKKYGIPEHKWTHKQVDEFTNTELIKLDTVIPGAENLTKLARRCGAKIVFLTGRSEVARKATRIWLENKLDIFETVPLVMRPDEDFRPTAECKEDIFLRAVNQVYRDSNFIFFEDDEELLLRYSKYGLALKAPECWATIRFLDKLPLSKEEQERRKPPPPEELVGALQDRIHKDIGIFRFAKTIKVKND